MLTVDIDEVKVAYPSMWELVEDLQDMGEGNAVIGRSDNSGLPSRDTHQCIQTQYHTTRHPRCRIGYL